MTIIVTGAYGQLGGELCRQLGDDALPLARDTLDLRQGPAVRDTILRLKPDLLINCAAYTQVDRAETEPDACRAINATAVGYLADACRELDCPLVQISTDYVFAGDNGRATPYREDDRPSPRGVYALTKLEAERAAARHVKHLIVRTCGLYARPTDQRHGNFVKTMLRLGRTQPRLRIVADQHCTPSYVPHVARAVLFLAGHDAAKPAPWGTYHITNAGATTWYGFASEIFRQADLDVTLEPISTLAYGAPAPRPPYSVLDIAAYGRLGGPPMPHWKTALREYFAELSSASVDSEAWKPQPMS